MKEFHCVRCGRNLKEATDDVFWRCHYCDISFNTNETLEREIAFAKKNICHLIYLKNNPPE